MGMLDGKKGLILGVANDHSIAWYISQALMDAGAELGFTHLPDKGDRNRMERRVRKLAEPVGAKLITPCDVQNDEDIQRVFAEAKEVYGDLDFVVHSIAYAPMEDLRCPYLESSRQGFHTAMDISVYSLVAVARAAKAVMKPGGSLVTLTYFGGEKTVPGYNIMGVCKAALDATVRYLAYDLGESGIRMNAISAGPIRTLSSSAVGEFDKMLGLYEAMSPLGRNVTPEEVGQSALYLLSDMSQGVTGEILHVDSGYNTMGAPGRGVGQLAGG